MLRQSLTYKLASVSEDAITLSARLFTKRFGIDVHHLRILRLIGDRPGLTFTDLAAETKFERTATSRSLRLSTASSRSTSSRSVVAYAAPLRSATARATEPVRLMTARKANTSSSFLRFGMCVP